MKVSKNETRTPLEYWNIQSKDMDEAWDMLEWLIDDAYTFQEAGCASQMSFFDPCSFHVRSYFEE